jgi:hypothetical protein
VPVVSGAALTSAGEGESDTARARA